MLQMHTAVKISPQYSGPVVYVLDASRSVPVVQSLLDSKTKVAFSEDIKEQYAENFDAESQQKLAVSGALSLYLNFVNIFQLLLNFTGERE